MCRHRISYGTCPLNAWRNAAETQAQNDKASYELFNLWLWELVLLNKTSLEEKCTISNGEVFRKYRAELILAFIKYPNQETCLMKNCFKHYLLEFKYLKI